MKSLDIRDIAIIDAFPVYNHRKIVLNVGCGEGRIDYHLARYLGYCVYATDIKKHSWPYLPDLMFYQSDIFNLESYPVKSAPIVICSQVLEHLKGYKEAIKNLLELTGIRLIITVPFEKSFHSLDHCNFWDDESVLEFVKLCKPYSVSISKIRTKPEDVRLGQFNYLIVIDKRQDKNG